MDFRQIAYNKTVAHVTRIRHLIALCIDKLNNKSAHHDDSKFTELELSYLAKIEEKVYKEGNAPFASPEYNERKKLLQPMLEHHYRNNSHHPEHFENGVNGMDLFDVVEMFCDWKAASERGEESSMNLQHACEKYKIDSQLKEILYNTAKNFKWKTD
jgi:hypothetical protein